MCSNVEKSMEAPFLSSFNTGFNYHSRKAPASL